MRIHCEIYFYFVCSFLRFWKWSSEGLRGKWSPSEHYLQPSMNFLTGPLFWCEVDMFIFPIVLCRGWVFEALFPVNLECGTCIKPIIAGHVLLTSLPGDSSDRPTFGLALPFPHCPTSLLFYLLPPSLPLALLPWRMAVTCGPGSGITVQKHRDKGTVLPSWSILCLQWAVNCRQTWVGAPASLVNLSVCLSFIPQCDHFRENMPSHFKFKEYCPMVFRNLRERFGIDDQDFQVSCFCNLLPSQFCHTFGSENRAHFLS